MRNRLVTLHHGWTIGATTHKEVELRPLNAGDIIDAGVEAERCIETANGPVLVQSPTLMGAAILRRQIARIGDLKEIAVTPAMLRGVDPEDFELLQQEAQKLDAAAIGSTEKRGRVSGGP